MSKRPKLDRSEVFKSLLGDISLLNDETEHRVIPLDQVALSANQPRRYIDERSLAALTDSIKQHGVIEPILVRRLAGAFEVVAGERRTRAARAAGLADIPAVVLDIDEEQAIEVSVIENLQREDLNAVEETDAILNLLALRLKKPVPEVVDVIRQLYDEARGRLGNNVISNDDRGRIEQLFRMVGRFTLSSFYVNRLPLLQLPEEVLETVRNGKLHYTKARRIARVEDRALRAELLEKAIKDSLSVAEIDALVRSYQNRRGAQDQATAMVREIKRSLTPGRLSSMSIEQQREVSELLARLKELLAR